MKILNYSDGKLHIRQPLLLLLILSLLSFAVYAAGQPTIIALQGKLTNESTGALISSATIRVNITSTNGETLWNETFVNGVSNGFFDVLLGTQSENPLNLTFNQDYNVSIYVGTSQVQIGGTYRFRGGQGLITPSNVSAGNFSATGNWNFGGAMHVDTTNNRVGIGTTTPSKHLEVSAGNDALVFDPLAQTPTINTTHASIDKNITIASADGSVIVQLG